MSIIRELKKHPEKLREPIAEGVPAQPMRPEVVKRLLAPAVDGAPMVYIDVTGVSMENEEIQPLADLCVKPPFRDAWIEWRDQGTQEARQHTCACRVTDIGELPGMYEVGIATVLACDSYLDVDEYGFVVLLGQSVLPLDAAGRAFRFTVENLPVARFIARATNSSMTDVDLFREATSRTRNEWSRIEPFVGLPELRGLGSTCVTVAGQTYGLLNCENVGVELVAPPHKKHAARGDAHGLAWHRLIVVKPGLRRKYAGAILPRGSGEPMTRAHLVRGHFKTFSAEAPLFGRYTGRFWWSPATRGDRHRGVVLKDYEVSLHPQA